MEHLSRPVRQLVRAALVLAAVGMPIAATGVTPALAKGRTTGPSFFFHQFNNSTQEGNSTFIFVDRPSTSSKSTGFVTATTSGGDPNNYTPASYFVRFFKGDTQESFIVATRTDTDTTPDPPITLTLSAPSTGFVGPNAILQIVEPPAASAPTGLTATANGTGEIDLSWTGSGNAASYSISRDGSSTCSTDAVNTTNYSSVATGVAAATYHDIGLTPGTKYCYTVQAANSAGALSGFSSPASATTLSGAPTALTATPNGQSEIDLNWSAPTGAVGSYSVSRDSSSTCATDAVNSTNYIALASSVSTTSYQNTGLTPGTTYCYAVQAVNSAAAAGAYSNVASATSAAGAPTNLTASPKGTGEIDLSWTAPTGGVSSYTVSRDTSGTCSTDAVNSTTYPALASGQTGTTYTNTGLSAGTTYCYVVQAVNSASAAGAYSNENTATTLSGAPSGLTATPNGTGEIDLSWTAPAGSLSSYTVSRDASATCATDAVNSTNYPVLASGQTGTTYHDTTAAAGTTYCYAVQAVNSAAAAGAYTPEASATTTPGAPTNLTATSNGSSEIDLGWTAPSGGVSSYTISRDSSASCATDAVNSTNFTVLASGQTGTTYHDTGLAANTLECYAVQAVNSAAASGAYSNPASATTAATVTPPTCGASTSACTATLNQGWDSTAIDTNPHGSGQVSYYGYTNSTPAESHLSIHFSLPGLGQPAGTAYRIGVQQCSGSSSNFPASPMSYSWGTINAPLSSGAGAAPVDSCYFWDAPPPSALVVDANGNGSGSMDLLTNGGTFSMQFYVRDSSGNVMFSSGSGFGNTLSFAIPTAACPDSMFTTATTVTMTAQSTWVANCAEANYSTYTDASGSHLVVKVSLSGVNNGTGWYGFPGNYWYIGIQQCATGAYPSTPVVVANPSDATTTPTQTVNGNTFCDNWVQSSPGLAAYNTGDWQGSWDVIANTGTSTVQAVVTYTAPFFTDESNSGTGTSVTVP